MSKRRWLVVKFCIYGLLGISMELIFNNFKRILSKIPYLSFTVYEFVKMKLPNGIPDELSFPTKYLFSMTNLWVFWVYATGALFIDFLYRHLVTRNVPLLVRALIYTGVIFVTEFCFGWLFRFILGEFVWRYESFLITTNLLIIPHWFLVAILADFVVSKLSNKNVEYAFCSSH